MATFPGAKVKRPARNKLGRGQSTPRAAANTTGLDGDTTDLQITFDVPVIVSGNIPLDVPGAVLVSQSQTSATQVHQIYDVNITGKVVPAGDLSSAVKTFQGGGAFTGGGTITS